MKKKEKNSNINYCSLYNEQYYDTITLTDVELNDEINKCINNNDTVKFNAICRNLSKEKKIYRIDFQDINFVSITNISDDMLVLIANYSLPSILHDLCQKYEKHEKIMTYLLNKYTSRSL